MSCELIIRPEAEADLTEAFKWYEARVPGLGLKFIRTVDSLRSFVIPRRIQSSIRTSVAHPRESSPMRSSSWLMWRALLFLLYSMLSVIPSTGKKENKAPQTNHSSGGLNARSLRSLDSKILGLHEIHFQYITSFPFSPGTSKRIKQALSFS